MYCGMHMHETVTTCILEEGIADCYTLPIIIGCFPRLTTFHFKQGGIAFVNHEDDDDDKDGVTREYEHISTTAARIYHQEIRQQQQQGHFQPLPPLPSLPLPPLPLPVLVVEV